MIVFADLAPGPIETVGSLCFTIPLLIPCFAVLFYIFQRVLRGPDAEFEEIDDTTPPEDPRS